MRLAVLAMACATAALSACGPSPAEQAVMDQQRCAGFGFQPNTDAFAHCMMQISTQRDAQAAADRRAAAAQAAANQRQQDAIQAAKDQADKDAWDRETGQGQYASPPMGASPNPVDAIRNQIVNDQQKIESGE
jgi:hypothetical protein